MDLTRIALWVRAASRFDVAPSPVLAFCKRMLELNFKADIRCDSWDGSGDFPFQCLGESVLRTWYRTQPKKGAGVAGEFRELFDLIARGETDAWRGALKKLLPRLLRVIDGSL